MDKIFGFSIKRVVVIMVCFICLATATTFITYYQLKPFAVKAELSELIVNDVTFAGIFINNLFLFSVHLRLRCPLYMHMYIYLFLNTTL